MKGIVGIGIDLVEVDRMEKAMTRYPERFRVRVFTEQEVRYCESRKNRFEHYAARFAAKEAAMKALGMGWGRGVSFPEIEVCRTGAGKPELILHGKTREQAEKIGVFHAYLSLSHIRKYAVAQVILTA
ncbi:MAG: holo-[acyl-carrier-protein] synthase [Deltaproteobacteria bacterium]|nr:holo-[acyl-carrier-protein] synthase [Deltaproteobacteria bacterium]